MELKIILVHCILIVLSYSDLIQATTHAEMDKLGEYCNGKEEDIKVMKSWRVPSSDTGKCLMQCVSNIYKMFDANGIYDEKTTEQSIIASWPDKPAKDAPIIAKHCEGMMRNAPRSKLKTCDLSYDLMKCINDKAWELGWFGH